ncbi:hypothetical protein [Pseudomonas putida]|jgi:hypothetical protein|nr:hypothetical protein [Pseudomonas putida]MDD2102172.1 hypothetical protein [Pseudomonas putida]
MLDLEMAEHLSQLAMQHNHRLMQIRISTNSGLAGKTAPEHWSSFT